MMQSSWNLVLNFVCGKWGMLSREVLFIVVVALGRRMSLPIVFKPSDTGVVRTCSRSVDCATGVEASSMR